MSGSSRARLAASRPVMDRVYQLQALIAEGRFPGRAALAQKLEVNPLKDAHVALDAAVLAAYGFQPKADLLAQLLHLNQTVATHLENGHPVTAPGLRQTFPNPETLVTDDCIRPT